MLTCSLLPGNAPVGIFCHGAHKLVRFESTYFSAQETPQAYRFYRADWGDVTANNEADGRDTGGSDVTMVGDHRSCWIDAVIDRSEFGFGDAGSGISSGFRHSNEPHVATSGTAPLF